MINTMWAFVQPYIYIPSAIYIVLTLFVYMMWLFGTDWFDGFKKLWWTSFDFMKAFFWWSLVINSIGYIFTDYFIYGWAAWNAWCTLVLIVYGFRFSSYSLHSFNMWCLSKRGKI